MSINHPDLGPGRYEITRGQLHKDGDGAWHQITSITKHAGRQPGGVLIGVAAWLLAVIGGGALYVSFSAQFTYIFAARRQDAASVIEALLLDLLMIVFTLLALGLSRAGKSSRTERALILACAAASAWMNMSAADTASPRSVIAYGVAPVALAVVVDRVVAVIRRHVLATDEASPWAVPGRFAARCVRLAGRVALYTLRFTLAAPETAKGLRQIVLDSAPLPAPPIGQIPWRAPRPGDAPYGAAYGARKARLLALYRAHPGYGDRTRASKVAAELAPQAGVQAGTARTYIYAELNGRRS
jgi:Protein of unknown function (DUF2637)